MKRLIQCLLLAAFLLIVGAWPAAAALIALAASGLSVVTAAVPGPVLLIAAFVWWRHTTAPATA